MSKSYQPGDILELDIERIVPRGYGLGFVEGLTIFVALAAAGDKLSVRLREVKGKTAFAEIEELIESSPDRIAPPCPYFGECGGCDFMHMNYAAQLEAKIAMIRDCLHRIAKIDYTGEIKMIESPRQFGYRLRAQWHANPHKGDIGYFRRNSRDLVDVEECIVLTPELQDKLRGLRKELDHLKEDTLVKIDAAAGIGGEVSIYSSDLSETAREISFTAADERLSFSAGSFFQGNRYLIDKLVETALGDAEGETALDLYSGVGLFTLPLARRFKKVIGVEDNKQAVGFAKRNAERAGLGNIDFYAASVRSYLASGKAPSPDFVLLDPPRFGTERDTIMNLIALRPKHVSYVACEPSILARDLKRFVENGYAIESITALDLFPQTRHVETVAFLKRAKS